MSKTYRQPNCHEDWQDVTKLRFKDSDEKIVAVFIDETIHPNKPPVVVIWQAFGGYNYTLYVNFDGVCESVPHRSVVIEIEIPTPEPDTQTIMKIMRSDFAVCLKDYSDRWAKINLVDVNQKIFWVVVGSLNVYYYFSDIKELFFTRDGETILTYNQVIEELNHEH